MYWTRHAKLKRRREIEWMTGNIMNGNVIVDPRRPIGSHYPSLRFYLALKFLKNNGRLSSFDLKIGGAISSYLWIMSHADDFTSWRWYHDTYHIYTLVFALLRLGSNLYIGLKHSRLICSFKRFHFRTNLKTGLYYFCDYLSSYVLF